jgi:D-methionine transport system permease protein
MQLWFLSVELPLYCQIGENSLIEVPHGLIETARALGASPFQIIRKVLLPEALPSLINNATITLITGIFCNGRCCRCRRIGQVGYQYGYIGYDVVIMNTVLILLVLLVFIIQFMEIDFLEFDHR